MGGNKGKGEKRETNREGRKEGHNLARGLSLTSTFKRPCSSGFGSKVWRVDGRQYDLGELFWKGQGRSNSRWV